MIWTRAFKSKTPKGIFPNGREKKTDSINQFVGRVEQGFKRLMALYPGRYDRSQLKERIFQGMHPDLQDSM